MILLGKILVTDKVGFAGGIRLNLKAALPHMLPRRWIESIAGHTQGGYVVALGNHVTPVKLDGRAYENRLTTALCAIAVVLLSRSKSAHSPGNVRRGLGQTN
jgi:hypothetical protein